MSSFPKPRRDQFRIFVVEDNWERIDTFEKWFPKDVRMLSTQEAVIAIRILQHEDNYSENFAGIMLDFDLNRHLYIASGDPPTGLDVTRVLVTKVAKDTPILVHSMNYRERHLIINMLKSNGFENVTQIPFKDLTEENLNKWIDECREIFQERLEDAA